MKSASQPLLSSSLTSVIHNVPGSIAARLLVVVWQLALGAGKLGLRLALHSLLGTRQPRTTNVGRTLVEVFEALGPTYLKLGQLLSTRPDLLSEPLLRQLETLRDRVSPAPFDSIPARFRNELGITIEEAFAEFDPSPIASASIAMVYRARLKDGRVVAVKVRRPGITKRIEIDLALLRLGTSLLQRIPALRLVPLRPAIDEFGRSLQRQVDFRLEAAAHRRMRAALACEPDIFMPELVEELCSASILTMDFIPELPSNSGNDHAPTQAALLTSLRALYRMIFVEGFIHCDMHRGNLHFLSNGQVVLIDFGFMAELEHTHRLKFAEFFYAMTTNDGRRCAQVILDTASSSPAALVYQAFEAEVIDLISRVSGATAQQYQVGKFVFSLFDLQRRYGLYGTPAFTMAIMSLLVFEGIAKKSYPDLDFQREARVFIMRALINSYQATPSTTSF